jgi:hypothetical protein
MSCSTAPTVGPGRSPSLPAALASRAFGVRWSCLRRSVVAFVGFGLVFVTGERVGSRWVVTFVRLGWSFVTSEGAGCCSVVAFVGVGPVFVTSERVGWHWVFVFVRLGWSFL